MGRHRTAVVYRVCRKRVLLRHVQLLEYMLHLLRTAELGNASQACFPPLMFVCVIASQHTLIRLQYTTPAVYVSLYVCYFVDCFTAFRYSDHQV